MSKFVNRIVCQILVVVFLGNLSSALLAQQIRRPQMSYSAGELFSPNFGQGTNDNFSAREIVMHWDNGSNLGTNSMVVFFNKKSRQIVQGQTNQVCFLNEKFVSFFEGSQHAIFVFESQPAEFQELTVENATNYFINLKTKTKHVRTADLASKIINLEPLLKQERKLHMGYQAFPFRKLEAKAEGKNIVLDFESFAHCKGKVVLDDQLNVKSMNLTEKSEWLNEQLKLQNE
jgi:hypothetical protein